MQDQDKPKGLWLHRFAIKVFTVLFAILVYWILGFLIEDIQEIKGPELNDIENKYVSQELKENRLVIDKKINKISLRLQESK